MKGRAYKMLNEVMEGLCTEYRKDVEGNNCNLLQNLH